MAKLQRDDAKMLWEEMGEKRSWKALSKTLEQHVEKSRGIENSTVLAMICEAEAFDRSGEEFPDSAGKLLKVVNEHLDQYQDCQQPNGKKAEKAEGKRADQSARNKSARDKSAQDKPDQKKQGQKQQQAARRQESKQAEQHRSEGEKKPSKAKRDQAAKPAVEQAAQPEAKHETQAAASKSKGEGAEEKLSAPKSEKPENRVTKQKRKIRLETYEPQHLDRLYKSGNWKNWDEMIQWLQDRITETTTGDEQLPADMVEAMIRDLQMLRDQKVPFNPDHEQVFEILHKPDKE